MKLDNRGFAITTVLYGTLILFLMLLTSMLGILSTHRIRMEKLIVEDNGARDIISGTMKTYSVIFSKGNLNNIVYDNVNADSVTLSCMGSPGEGCKINAPSGNGCSNYVFANNNNTCNPGSEIMINDSNNGMEYIGKCGDITCTISANVAAGTYANSITLTGTVNGDKTGVTYSWTGGSTASSASFTSTGTKTLTVRNSMGATAKCSKTITSKVQYNNQVCGTASNHAANCNTCYYCTQSGAYLSSGHYCYWGRDDMPASTCEGNGGIWVNGGCYLNSARAPYQTTCGYCGCGSKVYVWENSPCASGEATSECQSGVATTRYTIS